jgi:predicted nucleic acid-binding protein
MSLDLGIPMADSVMLATARSWDAILWSQDSDFAKVPGVRYLAKRGGGKVD